MQFLDLATCSLQRHLLWTRFWAPIRDHYTGMVTFGMQGQEKKCGHAVLVKLGRWLATDRPAWLADSRDGQRVDIWACPAYTGRVFIIIRARRQRGCRKAKPFNW